LDLEKQLKAFAAAHRLALSPAQIQKLVRLEELLGRWGKAVGLTAYRSNTERFARYFAEPLHASLWAPPVGPAWDLGSGGGTPALPLAVAHPGLQFTLVEPNRRKGVFLEEALRELELSGSRVVRARLEDIGPREPLLLLTSRGLAAARGQLARWGKWLAPGGRMLFFTGREKAGKVLLPAAFELTERVALAPDEKTTLLVICRAPKAARQAPEAGLGGPGESDS
jgi:16S rRNA (guanine527-N7)-methyltransferase